MEKKKMLPIGIEFFNEIINDNFYYIDKTGLIRDLLNDRSKVTLFTRPRRFGKTLNMSMLQSFFEIGTDKKLFDGLEIPYLYMVQRPCGNGCRQIYQVLSGIHGF